jgi:hypothetical protein
MYIFSQLEMHQKQQIAMYNFQQIGMHIFC